MKKLCIVKNEKVWSVSIDICTINADGNLFDACSLAAMAALADVKMPEMDKNYVVDYKKKTKKGLPMLKQPIGVTVWKVGDTIVVDPTRIEEKVFDTRLTVTTLANGEICAMQKGREASLTAKNVADIISIAKKQSKELRKHL